MDIQLQELIEKIKTDGVQSAEQQAETILADAKQQADGIVVEARKKGDSIIRDARKETDQMRRAGEEALVQAGRDLILSLEKKITRIFDEIVRAETESALKGNTLADILVSLAGSWTENQSSDLSVLLPPEELKDLEEILRTKLAETLKKGVEIKPLDSIDSGFRIEEKDGSAYYNFTAEGFAEILGEFVNPRLEENLRRAAARE